jgi:aryl-alcohol dehydrogenase-like predicted oxidoreductase
MCIMKMKIGINLKKFLSHLDKFIKEGKIRDIGLSNETPWGVSKCLNLAKNQNLPRMMSVQNPYSLLNRTYEVGLAEISIRDEIGLLAYSPLASGYLTGKYRNNQLPKNSRLERDGDFGHDITNPIQLKLLMHIMKYLKNIILISLKWH